jgi:hypothetical protein
LAWSHGSGAHQVGQMGRVSQFIQQGGVGHLGLAEKVGQKGLKGPFYMGRWARKFKWGR